MTPVRSQLAHPLLLILCRPLLQTLVSVTPREYHPTSPPSRLGPTMTSMAVDLPAWIEWQRLLLVRERVAEEADALGGGTALPDPALQRAGVRGAERGV